MNVALRLPRLYPIVDIQRERESTLRGMRKPQSPLRKYYWFWEKRKFADLQRDMKINVRDGLTGKFDGSFYRALDAIARIAPDDSSVENRIYQAYTGWPQVRRNIQNRGIRREDLLAEIRRLVKEQTQVIEEGLARKESKG